MKFVCPILSACNQEEFKNCIGSDCALWVDDYNEDAEEADGCCGLACSGIQNSMYPQVFKDPEGD